MALEITTLKDKEHNVSKFKSDRRLWETADGRIVEDGDPDAAILHAAPGKPISAEVAEQFGIGQPAPVEEPVEDETAAKKRTTAANKRRKAAQDK